MVLAVLVYLAISVLAFWPAQPLSRWQIPSCACGDQIQEVWFLGWITHALIHGVNPFFTTDINHPYGVNLALNTSMPLLGLLASPVTLLRGPVAAYNVMMRLGFATSATSMFFVCRRFTRRSTPAFLAGLLYGFSPYTVGQGNGHLFLLFVPLPPVILLLSYDLCRGAPSTARRTGLVLGLLAAAQYFISIEVLVTTGMCVCIGFAVGACVHPALARARAATVLGGLGAALVVFVPLVAYPLYFFFLGPQHVSGPPQPVAALARYRIDLFGAIVPTIEQRFAPSGLAALGSSYSAGSVGENGSYLGIPLVLVLLVAIVRYRREPLVTSAAAVGLCCYILALGTPLTIDNSSTGLPMPFALLTRVPGLDGLLAGRFTLYVQLTAAFVLAVGTDRVSAGSGSRPARRTRELLVSLVAAGVLVPLVPNFPYPSQPASVPAYFTTGLERAIPSGSLVLTYPYDYSPNNEGMLWQALTGYRFAIIGGEATRPGPNGKGTSGVYPLAPTELQNLFRAGLLGRASRVPAPPITGLGLQRVRKFFTRWHVGTVVVEPIGADPELVVHYLTVALRRAPKMLGGVDVWYRTSSD